MKSKNLKFMRIQKKIKSVNLQIKANNKMM